jgi:hypothetical protein
MGNANLKDAGPPKRFRISSATHWALSLKQKFDQKTPLELFILYSSIIMIVCGLSGFDTFSPEKGFHERWFDLESIFTFGYASGKGTGVNSSELTASDLLNIRYCGALVLSALLIFFGKTRRAGGLLLLAVRAHQLLHLDRVGVLGDFFTLFGFAMVTFGPKQREAQKSFLVGGFVAGFVMSALQKLNGFYLSGKEVAFQLSYLTRFDSRILTDNPGAASAASLCGVLFEALAGLALWRNATAMTLGVLSVEVFVTGIFLSINNSHIILRFFMGLVFLFEFPWAKANFLIFLLAWPFIFTVTQGLLFFLVGGNDEFLKMSSSALFIVYALSYLISVGFLTARYGKSRLEVGRKSLRYLFMAVALCALYGIASRIFALPTPLGWTQFSGADHDRETTVLYLRGDHLEDLSKDYFSWGDGSFYCHGTIIVGSQIESSLDRVLARACQLSQSPVSVVRETMKWGDFIQICKNQDRTLGSHLPASPLDCTGAK